MPRRVQRAKNHSPHKSASLQRLVRHSWSVSQELADLTPAEPWGDSRQNCLHDMRIVGNT